MDQVILLQQTGKNAHAHIIDALDLFASKVMPEFQAEAAEREAKKARDLAPYIEAAMERKDRMPALAESEIPIVRASRSKAETMQDRESAIGKQA